MADRQPEQLGNQQEQPTPAGAQLEHAAPVLEQLEMIVGDLLARVDGLSIKELEYRAGSTEDHNRAVDT